MEAQQNMGKDLNFGPCSQGLLYNSQSLYNDKQQLLLTAIYFR